MPPLSLPPLPSFRQAALLLDVDGTLLDFAPTPETVAVPADLPDTLRRLKALLGGAVGVISGRPVEQVDLLFGDAPHAVAGEHGGAVRHAPGAALERVPLPSVPEDWVFEAERTARMHPGARMERKARGFVLHYRAVPEAGAEFGEALRRLMADNSIFELLAGNMAWEVRPRGADKGGAVAMLMRRAPFAGRLPVFVGDDVTDLDGISMAQKMGGAGLLVADAFGGPSGVRAWLQATAMSGGW